MEFQLLFKYSTISECLRHYVEPGQIAGLSCWLLAAARARVANLEPPLYGSSDSQRVTRPVGRGGDPGTVVECNWWILEL